MKLLGQPLEFPSVTDIISDCGNKCSEIDRGREKKLCPKRDFEFWFYERNGMFEGQK
jgi:hypothetical protein